MIFIIGSTNKTKVQAAQQVLETLPIKAELLAESVPSGVKKQPIGETETREGAINRAKAASLLREQAIGIGLEGGIRWINGELFLCNWGALYTPDGSIITAAGAQIRLPSQFTPALQEGDELSVLMDAYCQKDEIRSNEGAIGIFTADYVNRTALFEHVMKLLIGQWVFQMKQ